jgi:hypothetical protein
VVVLVFDGWDVAYLTVESSMVVPVDVLGGGEYDVGQRLPWPPGLDQPGFEQADYALHQGVVVGVADRSDRGGDAGSVQVLGEPENSCTAIRRRSDGSTGLAGPGVGPGRAARSEQGGNLYPVPFQRPDKRAVEQDPEAVRLWHEETWPAIRAKAKAENAEVLFGDQVGVRPDQVTGRTRGAKGQKPIVRRTGNPFSMNAMSAISTRGRMHFMVFTEPFDAKVMCRFLARLVGHFDRKVHLIADRHSAHRSKTVRAWALRPQG